MFYAQFEFYDIKFNIFNPNVNEYYYTIHNLLDLKNVNEDNYLVKNQNIIFKSLNNLLSKLNFFSGLLNSNLHYQHSQISKPLELVRSTQVIQQERIFKNEKN